LQALVVLTIHATHVVPIDTNPAVKHSLGHAATVLTAHYVQTFDDDRENPAIHLVATDETEHVLNPAGHKVHNAPAATYHPGKHDCDIEAEEQVTAPIGHSLQVEPYVKKPAAEHIGEHIAEEL